MPMASVSTTVAVKPGRLASTRTAYLKSRSQPSTAGQPQTDRASSSSSVVFPN